MNIKCYVQLYCYKHVFKHLLTVLSVFHNILFSEKADTILFVCFLLVYT